MKQNDNCSLNNVNPFESNGKKTNMASDNPFENYEKKRLIAMDNPFYAYEVKREQDVKDRDYNVEAFKNGEKISYILKDVANLLDIKPVKFALGEIEAFNPSTQEIICPLDSVATVTGYEDMLRKYIKAVRYQWSLMEHRVYKCNPFVAFVESEFFVELYEFIHLNKKFTNSDKVLTAEIVLKSTREAWKEYLLEYGALETKMLFERIVKNGLIRDLPSKEALYAVK